MKDITPDPPATHKISIEEDPQKGKMVCATRLLPAGTVIGTFTGRPIHYQKTLGLGDQESFALQVGIDQYIFLDAPYRFFNHSCEPNCGLTPGLQLVSLTDIERGEELTYDYSTTMLEHHWEMECHCGKPSCRRRIADFTTLPVTLQHYYLARNIVQTFIVTFMENTRR